MRIGTLLPSLAYSQIAFDCITHINEEATKSVEDDYTIFYENLTVFCLTPLCGVMTPDEICLFNDGVLISTTISGLETCQKVVNTSKKVLYLADLEWIRPRYNRKYLENYSVLNDDNILICRSDYHKKILRNYCDRSDILVMRDFNVPEIAKIVKEMNNDKEEK